MKCKVCGYEFDPTREYCPMCGSKVPGDVRRKEEEEMSWNTYDFPKPKKPEDIEMHWPSMSSSPNGTVSMMKKDASEGFVRAASPAGTESARDPEMPPQPQPAPQQPVQQAPQQGAWQMPHMQETPAWTPYNVQQPQQTMQMPPISTAYVPTSFTQAYAPQYSQPQTAWTVPPQPQPGQQVYVTQPAQPVYIQPAQPVYAPVYPPYTQPPVPQQPAPQQAPVQQQAPQQTPASQPEPAPAPAPAPEAPKTPEPEVPAAEPEEKILRENIVATVEEPKKERPLFAEEPEEEPKEEPHEEPHEEPVPDEDGKVPERFFTFNKKNEEFQQLLNQEYERLRDLHDGDLPDDLSRTAFYKKDTFRPTPAQDFFFNNDLGDDLGSSLSEFERMLMEDTKDPDGGETLSINRDRIKGAAVSVDDLIDPLPVKPGDTHPLGEPVPATEEPEEEEEPETPAEPAEPAVPLSKEELARREHRERMAAMARAREAYFASLRTMTAEMKAIKDAEFKAQLEKEARVSPDPVVREKAPEKTPEEIEAEKAEEARLAAEREAAEREAAIERAKAEMLAAQEAQEAQKKEQEEEAQKAEPEEKLPEEPQEEQEPEQEPLEEDLFAEELDIALLEAQESGSNGARRNRTAVFDEILDDVDEENKRREKKEHNHGFLKFLLGLLILAAVAEGGTIALRHFAPESPASVITTGIEQQVIQYVETGVDKIKGLFHKGEEEPAPQGDAEPQGEDAVFVLSDIIAEMNKNIESVTENLGIGYDPQRTYDIPGLDASELVTDAAEKTAVCKTLIGYNSSWIDYVNGVDQECLNYLKADGAAYRSAVTFDKIGEVTERFLKLELGEIRKTEDSYFVFAGESIEVTQGDETVPSAGFMVYEMVPVGEELKIKDYYNITN